jgi:hypothetical protein
MVESRGGQQVHVPDVVGMTVLAGGRAAATAEVVLAQVDADGPPLGAMLWTHESQYVITSQSPAAGTVVRPFDSVVVTFELVDGLQGVPVRRPRRPSPLPGHLRLPGSPQ